MKASSTAIQATRRARAEDYVCAVPRAATRGNRRHRHRHSNDRQQRETGQNKLPNGSRASMVSPKEIPPPTRPTTPIPGEGNGAGDDCCGDADDLADTCPIHKVSLSGPFTVVGVGRPRHRGLSAGPRLYRCRQLEQCSGWSCPSCAKPRVTQMMLGPPTTGQRHRQYAIRRSVGEQHRMEHNDPVSCERSRPRVRPRTRRL